MWNFGQNFLFLVLINLTFGEVTDINFLKLQSTVSDLVVAFQQQQMEFNSTKEDLRETKIELAETKNELKMTKLQVRLYPLSVSNQGQLQAVLDLIQVIFNQINRLFI